MMPVIPQLPSLSGDFGPFPGRGVDKFLSSGDADGWRRLPLEPEFQFEFFGIDDATEVWRSDPVVVGSRDDLFGVPVGPPQSDIVIAQKDIRLRPQLPIDPLAGAGTRRKFFAELHSLHLKADGLEILAGEPFRSHLADDLGLTDEEIAQIFRRSYGEIIAWNLGGDPKHDFPADNYFNVFFGLKLKPSKNLPAVTLFNKAPMLVVDQGITETPPLRRVTIPQFPFNITELYFVRDPFDGGRISQKVAAAGNCCAHGVAIEEKLRQGALDFGAILEETTTGGTSFGVGIELGSGRVVSSAEAVGIEPAIMGSFVPIPHNRFIDSIFVPSGVTQITTSGATVRFPTLSIPTRSDAIRNGASSRDSEGNIHPIHVMSPVEPIPYQPPQLVGIGMGLNAGITFDLSAIRSANPEFYLVEFVAFEGMSLESSRDAGVRLRVFVDGAEVPYADNTFQIPGASLPIRVDLQRATRFLTLVSTPAETMRRPGYGVFALMELRGFGNPQVGKYIQYWRNPQYRASL